MKNQQLADKLTSGSWAVTTQERSGHEIESLVTISDLIEIESAEAGSPVELTARFEPQGLMIRVSGQWAADGSATTEIVDAGSGRPELAWYYAVHVNAIVHRALAD
jgi:hypothetical protein